VFSISPVRFIRIDRSLYNYGDIVALSPRVIDSRDATRPISFQIQRFVSREDPQNQELITSRYENLLIRFEKD
jgi:hypothetical protein